MKNVGLYGQRCSEDLMRKITGQGESIDHLNFPFNTVIRTQ